LRWVAAVAAARARASQSPWELGIQTGSGDRVDVVTGDCRPSHPRVRTQPQPDDGGRVSS
jgi:hypothetical protein